MNKSFPYGNNAVKRGRAQVWEWPNYTLVSGVGATWAHTCSTLAVSRCAPYYALKPAGAHLPVELCCLNVEEASLLFDPLSFARSVFLFSLFICPLQKVQAVFIKDLQISCRSKRCQTFSFLVQTLWTQWWRPRASTYLEVYFPLTLQQNASIQQPCWALSLVARKRARN